MRKYYSIYLTGGQVIEITASDLIIEKGVTGLITGLKWFNPVRETKYLNPQHILAIVEDS